MGGTRLNKPVVGMVRYGNGYLMVGSDGGIFDFSEPAVPRIARGQAAARADRVGRELIDDENAALKTQRRPRPSRKVESVRSPGRDC